MLQPRTVSGSRDSRSTYTTFLIINHERNVVRSPKLTKFTFSVFVRLAVGHKCTKKALRMQPLEGHPTKLHSRNQRDLSSCSGRFWKAAHCRKHSDISFCYPRYAIDYQSLFAANARSCEIKSVHKLSRHKSVPAEKRSIFISRQSLTVDGY